MLALTMTPDAARMAHPAERLRRICPDVYHERYLRCGGRGASARPLASGVGQAWGV